MALKTAEIDIYNGFRLLCVDVIGYGTLSASSELSCDNVRIRYAISDMEVDPQFDIVDERYATYGGTSNVSVESSLSCSFPTYVRFDLEKLSHLPEGKEVIIAMEEGFVREGEYTDSKRTPLPKVAELIRFIVPKRFVCDASTQFNITADNERWRPFSSNVGALFTPSMNVNVTRNGVTDLASAFNVYSIIGSIKQFAADIENIASLDTVVQKLKITGADFNATTECYIHNDHLVRIRRVDSEMSSAVSTSVDAEKYKGIADENIVMTATMEIDADITTDAINISNMEFNASTDWLRIRGNEADINAAATLDVSKINGYPWDDTGITISAISAQGITDNNYVLVKQGFTDLTYYDTSGNYQGYVHTSTQNNWTNAYISGNKIATQLGTSTAAVFVFNDVTSTTPTTVTGSLSGTLRGFNGSNVAIQNSTNIEIVRISDNTVLNSFAFGSKNRFSNETYFYLEDTVADTVEYYSMTTGNYVGSFSSPSVSTVSNYGIVTSSGTANTLYVRSITGTILYSLSGQGGYIDENYVYILTAVGSKKWKMYDRLTGEPAGTLEGVDLMPFNYSYMSNNGKFIGLDGSDVKIYNNVS